MQQDIYDQENFNFIQQEDRNWSERILQDVIGLLHILSPTGKVLYCSESCIELTGYSPFELIGKSLTDFIHTDDLDIFARNFQLAFTSLSRIKTHYRIRRKDNTYVLLESIGHPKQNVPHQPPQSFFGIAQPYLSRSNGLMDSFLELKMENEWLKKRLNQLIQDTTYQAVQPPPPPQYGHQYFQTDDRRPSNCSSILFQTNNGPDDHSWNSPPDEFNELLRYNQEDYLSSSNSVTTNTDKWKRRKKHRSVDDYVCSDCGTSASPEWRKGPHGPKTLCNACGLRWAKKNKKI